MVKKLYLALVISWALPLHNLVIKPALSSINFKFMNISNPRRGLAPP
jgi:hypothetical protein